MFNADRLIAVAEAGRKCVRCRADVHPSDGPHLCKDVRGRLNMYRNERRHHLRRLVRRPRCVVHDRPLVDVCGTLSCGLCYEASLADPAEFRRRPPAFTQGEANLAMLRLNAHFDETARRDEAAGTLNPLWARWLREERERLEAEAQRQAGRAA